MVKKKIRGILLGIDGGDGLDDKKNAGHGVWRV
jgi:hypothetical protein